MNMYNINKIKEHDHRKIGKKLNLFHVQEESPGMIFWHPKGYILWNQIKKYIKYKMNNANYSEIKTPIIINRSLWEKSGHWKNYHKNMFITKSEYIDYVIKPMNCPGHIQMFKYNTRSYKDLPIKYIEFGTCHRNELSGSLYGLMRLRSFVQDDSHIFCRNDQITNEIIKFNKLAIDIYKIFGFKNINIKLSLRPNIRIGNDEIWNQSENKLRKALNKCNISWKESPGDGAFYGPKIDYHIKDSLNRSWQCGTLQLDLILSKYLNAKYVSSNNNKYYPTILHHAVIGSIERFLGILIEHYSGYFPTWLSPIQVIIITITKNHFNYAKFLTKYLKKKKIRVSFDYRDEKIGYKIREHILQKIPYLLIIGDNECRNKTISVRSRNNKTLGVMSIDNFIKYIKNDISKFK